MSEQPNGQVLAVMTDVFFAVKILDAAKKEGMAAKMVKTEESANAAVRQRPELVFVDLNCTEMDTVGLIRAWKADDELCSVPVVGFLSHVFVELKQAAAEAGCDVVLARSSLTQNLQELMHLHSPANR
jgi:CheY-like chemotaxis protein